MVGLSQGHAVFCIVMGYDDDHDDDDNINTKITCFFGKFSQMCEPTQPRVFAGFGKTKGKIRVLSQKKTFLNLPLPENSHSPSS